MIKKIITWVTKGTKITNIFKYVYQGCFIILSTLIGLKDSIIEVNNEKINKYVDIISTIIDYLQAATSGVETVLSWLGLDVEKESAEIIKAMESEENINDAKVASLKKLKDLLNTELKS
jgi:phage-related protein